MSMVDSSLWSNPTLPQTYAKRRHRHRQKSWILAAVARLMPWCFIGDTEMGDEKKMNKRIWSKSETRQWTIILFLGTICVYSARVSLPICAVAIGKEYKWSKTEAGTVLACFFWGYASTQAPAGWLADKFGGDNCLIGATMVWGAITVCTPMLFDLAYMTSMPLPCLILVRICMGLAQGFHFPSTASLVSSRLIASEKGRVFGIATAGSHFGTVLCGSFGSILLENFGWRTVMYFIGSLGLCWAFYMRALLHNKNLLSPSRTYSAPLLDNSAYPEKMVMNGGATSKNNAIDIEKQRLLTPHAVTLTPSDSAIFNNPDNFPLKDKGDRVMCSERGTPVPWGKLCRRPEFWAAFIAHYCGANAFFTLFSWLPSYFSETYPNTKGWVFNVVPHSAIAITSLIAPYIAARLIVSGHTVTFTRRIMECISLGGLALCLFGVAQIETYSSALMLFALAMACRGMHHGGVCASPQDFAPNHTGAVFGLLNMAGAIPGFVGVYVAGYILERTHSWPIVFALTGGQCIIGMIAYGLLGTGRQLI